jgi:hypothetical protein
MSLRNRHIDELGTILRYLAPMIKTPNSLYRGHRFPAEVIAHAVWLYFRFPLSLRMVEDLLAARGVIVSHETVRRWAEKFGRDFANKIRRRASRFGDKWHLDEVAVTINGKKHWLWRAVDALVFDDLHIGAFAGLFEAEEHGPSQQDTMESDS